MVIGREFTIGGKDCQIEGGEPHIIDTPLPTINVSYQYILERISSCLWKLRIARMDGEVIVSVDIPNPGFNYGDKVQVGGEVDSWFRMNEMGISDLKSLLWMDSSAIWHSWNGWIEIIPDPPYKIDGIAPDEGNNVRISGNNGTPVPTTAPCP